MWEQGTFHFVFIFSCTGTTCGHTSYCEVHETSPQVWYVCTYIHTYIHMNLNVTLSFLVIVINIKTLRPQRSLSVSKWFCEWRRLSQSKRLTTLRRITFCSNALAFFRAKRGRHVLRKRDSVMSWHRQFIYWGMSSFTTASTYTYERGVICGIYVCSLVPRPALCVTPTLIITDSLGLG